MQGSGFNRLQLVRDARGELVRRVWPRPEIGGALGMAPEVEVAAQQLAAQHGLAPEVLEYDARNRAMLMPFVAGGSLEPDWFLRRERRAAVRDLLERLRQIPATNLPPLDLAQRLRELCDRLAARDREAADRRSTDVEQVLLLIEAVPRATESAVLVHGDLHPQNVIVRTDGSLCLLDWEYAHRGHGDEDLAGLATGVLPQHALAHSAELARWSLQPSSFDLRRRLRALLDAVWLDLAATGGEQGPSRAN